ncbi:MAG TPA: peptidylprolyl isomerase [Pyrinomonadaceae bacterium]|nr:peptidylprolyl isomerase [Pyrinomonadaceae bacterium]
MKATLRLSFCLLCACWLAPAGAGRQPGTVAAAGPRAVRQAAPQRPAPAEAKKNARRPADERAAGEPFDKATPAEMSRQCVTLDTEEGTVVVEMLAEAAPENARNFLNLAATGAFDTTTFSRVVRGFIVQGGNLWTRETMPPALAQRARRTVGDEPSEVKHTRGVVSMARTAEPNSATTHFFILVGDGPHLDGTFSAFGRVRSGMEAVDKMNAAEVEGDAPKKPVRLRRATAAPCPAPEAPPQP